MPNNYLEIPVVDMDAGSVVVESVMLQLIENQRYFIDQLALASRYASIVIKVEFGLTFAATVVTVTDSEDGFSVAVTESTFGYPSLELTLSDDWSSAQVPFFIESPDISLSPELPTTTLPPSGFRYTQASSVADVITTQSAASSENHIKFIEIKYDRLGVLPV